MKVAELYAELSTRGNLRQELREADRGLDAIVRTAGRAEQQLRDVEVPQTLRRDAQQTERAVGQIGTAAAGARADLRRVEMPQTIRRDAAQAERAVADIGRTGRQVEQQLSGIGNGLRDSMNEASASASESGSSGGGAFLAGFSSRIGALGSKAGPIGLALTAVLGVGLVAGKQLADAVMDGFEQSAQRDFSQQKFGLTDAQMKAAGAAAGGAFGNAWGESVQSNIDTAGIAIQTGLLNGNETSAAMQPVIEKLTMVSDLMGTEIPETAKAAGQMVRTGLVANGVEAMDLLTAAQQHGLNISDDLLETVNEYGTQWRKAGLDGQTALGLVSQAMQGGARDSDVAADAIKEFAIRASDGSESTASALQTLGLNVDDMTAKFAKGGPAAREGLDNILDKLREMPPSVERNQVAAALFGTQWEDLGGAFDKLDLSNASTQLGMVTGAADRAAAGMDNPANRIQAIKNQISMAADTMKMKLAEAFAPSVENATAWIAENKDEIIAWLTEAGAKALDFMATSAHVAAELLRFGANTTGAFASMFGSFIENIGKTSATLGSVIKHIPGLGDTGRTLEGVGNAAAGMGGEMQKGADRARAMADAIDSHVVPGLRGAADGLRNTAAEARETQAGVDYLTTTLAVMPDGKTVTITDNSPETIRKLNDLGLYVTTLPDGNIAVHANTEDGQTKLDGFITAANGRQATVGITVSEDEKAYFWRVVGAFRQMNPQGSASATPRADGGEEPAPSEAAYLAGRRRMLVAEEETGGEWYIPKSSAKRARSTSVLANAADSFGYGLIPRADGGDETGLPPIASSIWHAVKSRFPDATLNSGVRPGDSGYHGIGQAIDVGGPMQQIADFMFGTYRGQLAQLIWNAGPVLYNVKKNQLGTGVATADGAEARAIYGESEMANHADHVHLAAEDPLPEAAAGAQQPVGPRTIPLVQNPDGTWTSTDPTWAALIKRESGGNPTIVQGITDANSGGNEASGLFQIAKGTWSGAGGLEFAPTAGEARPEDQAVVAARIFDRDGGSPWGAGLAGREDEAGLAAGITTATVPGGSGATAAPVSSTTSSSGVQNVFVVGGKLDGTSSAPAEKDADHAPVASLGVALYSRGGTVGPSSNPVSGYGTDTVPALLTPEEEVTRAPMARKHRALLKAIDADRVAQFAEGGTVGGFGGYTTAGAKYRKGYNWYDLLAGGVGAGFAVASGFDDSGKFKGFDSGSTDIPGTSALIDRLTEIAKKPTVVITHATFPNAKDAPDMIRKVMGIDPARNQTRLNL